MEQDQKRSNMKKVFIIIGILIVIFLFYFIVNNGKTELQEEIPTDTVNMEDYNLSHEEMIKGVQGDFTWEQADSINNKR